MQHESFWWTLPGPASFLDSVEGDIGSGRSVLFVLPEHHPPGLFRALRRRIEDGGDRRFWTLDLATVESVLRELPAHALHELYVPREEWAGELSVEAVARSRYLRETVLLIEGMNATLWPAWREFLEHYMDECRSQDPYERLVFVVALVGELGTGAMASEVALKVRRWRDVIQRIDMMLYATRLVERIDRSSAVYELAVATIVEVAGSDPVLAGRIAGAELERLLNPREVVLALARERGWHPSPESALKKNGEERLWHRGQWIFQAGAGRLHSAATGGEGDTLARRIWRAQVSVLFPFLEERRLDFIHDFRRHISVPLDTRHGHVERAELLELSDLHHLLRTRVSRQRLEPLRECLWLRNELAHLRPVAPHHLLDALGHGARRR